MRRPETKISPNLDEAIECALEDLRIVRKMMSVADYFLKQVEFAVRAKVNYFIIDYDEGGILSDIVEVVSDKSHYYDIKYIYYGGNKKEGIPYIAAYIVKRFLPDNIDINYSYCNDGSFGVSFTIN